MLGKEFGHNCFSATLENKFIDLFHQGLSQGSDFNRNVSFYITQNLPSMETVGTLHKLGKLFPNAL